MTEKLNTPTFSNLPIDCRFVEHQYSAIDWVDTLLEFFEMEPNPKNWNFKYLKKWKPYFVRLQYIVALAEALLPDQISESIYQQEKEKTTQPMNGYETWVVKMAMGSFILRRNMDFYKNSKALKPYLKLDKNKGKNITQIDDIHDMLMLFNMLLSYKKSC